MIRKSLYRFYQKRNNEEVLSKLDELEKNQWLTSDKLEQLQNRRLLEIIKLAIKNVPYYQKVGKKVKINTNNVSPKDIIKQFPVLTKHDIINNYDALINSNFRGEAYKNFSGGVNRDTR